jgi:hypothetical protein
MSSETAVFSGDCDARGRISFDIPAQVTAYCRAHFAGARVDVEIRRRKARRSDRQNRAFHASLMPWARELGYHVEELKDELLGLVWGYEERVSRLTGEVTRHLVKPHTSHLTTAEFSELMAFTVIKAAETGYHMLLPDEFRLEQRTSGTTRTPRPRTHARLTHEGEPTWQQ